MDQQNTTEGTKMDLLELFGLMDKYSALGDAVGSQWKAAAEAYFNGSDNPVDDEDMNPNAFSDQGYSAIGSFMVALERSGVEGADEFLAAVRS